MWGRGFSERAIRLAAQYGKRFEPPRLLFDKASRDEQFDDAEHHAVA
jgi:3-hydroxyacyl-CoA dehydrogenase / enoyl-CoA hydratase / 3-hydroxybutyryl-CoA epimerase